MSKRISVELNKLQNKQPIQGVTVNTDGDNVTRWIVKIEGPAGSPYEGGILTLKIDFPDNYPHKAPIIAFYPIPVHPNVNQKDGIPCLEEIQDKYSPSTPMSKILNSLIEMLKNPNPGHAQEGEIAQLFLTDPEAYKKRAVEWTKKYAH